MARERSNNGSPMETVISIIGPGMTVVGDCQTDGTIRVEGSVKGSVKAGKAVVVGKDGLVEGDIVTQDAVVSGTVKGTLLAESRLELQATCHVEGEVRARRMQLEEGAILNGTVDMGGNPKGTTTTTPDGQAVPLQAAGQAAGPVPASAHDHEQQHEHEPQHAAE